VSCAKTAEQTEMPFRMLCRMDPRNHVWDGIQIPAGRDNFEGGGACPGMSDDTLT